MKCSIKIKEGRKWVEDKKETKHKGNEQKIVTKMIAINPTTLVWISYVEILPNPQRWYY